MNRRRFIARSAASAPLALVLAFPAVAATGLAIPAPPVLAQANSNQNQSSSRTYRSSRAQRKLIGLGVVAVAGVVSMIYKAIRHRGGTDD